MPAPRSARKHDPVFHLVDAARGRVLGALDRGAETRHVGRIDPRPHRLRRDRLVRSEAEELSEAAIEGGGAGDVVQVPQSQLGRLQREPPLLLALGQPLLGPLPLGDVEREADDPAASTTRAGDHASPAFEPSRAPGRVEHPVLAVVAPARIRDRSVPGRLHAGVVVRVHRRHERLGMPFVHPPCRTAIGADDAIRREVPVPCDDTGRRERRPQAPRRAERLAIRGRLNRSPVAHVVQSFAGAGHGRRACRRHSSATPGERYIATAASASSG